MAPEPLPWLPALEPQSLHLGKEATCSGGWRPTAGLRPGMCHHPVQGHKQQCQQKEGKGPWLGCHRALAKPPITPLSMIGPKNHPSKLGALEKPHIFKNKPHPAKSSKGQKEDLEGNEIFRADRKRHSDTLSSVGCRGDFTAPGDEVRETGGVLGLLRARGRRWGGSPGFWKHFCRVLEH